MSFGRGDLILGPAAEHIGKKAHSFDQASTFQTDKPDNQCPVFYFRGPSATNQKQQQEIVPMDLHHPILREFPEHRDTIKRLRSSSDHFRSLFDEYHRLDDEIYQIEEDLDFATDQQIEELKMRRAKLKDYIYHVVRHAPPAPPAPTPAQETLELAGTEVAG